MKLETLVYRHFLVVFITGLLISACAAGSREEAPPTSKTKVVGSTTTPVTFGGIAGLAESARCSADARSMQEAADAYRATHAHPAPSAEALVGDGELRHLPATQHGYVISYDPRSGQVTASGACRFGG